MQAQKLLPKRVVDYIHEMGVRALDHLAEAVHQPLDEAGAEAEGASNAVQALIDHWRSMNADDKEEFVERIASSVVEVVAASAILPQGLKLNCPPFTVHCQNTSNCTRRPYSLAK